MIILHSKKLLFVHISKCAGMSVAHNLESISSTNDIFLNGPRFRIKGNKVKEIILNSMRNIQYMQQNSPTLLKHSLFSEIAKVYPYESSEYLSFAIIRNPYDRTRSIFNYIFNTKQLPRLNALRKIFINIRDMQDVSQIDKNGIYQHLLLENYFKPQVSFVKGIDGGLGVKKLVNLQDITSFLRNCGCSQANSKNLIKNRSLTNYFHNQEEIINITEKYYADDINLFNSTLKNA